MLWTRPNFCDTEVISTFEKMGGILCLFHYWFCDVFQNMYSAV